MSLIAAGIRTLLYTLSGGVDYHLIIYPLCDKAGRGENIYYIKHFYQEQVRGQATLLEHQHIIDSSLTILTMISYSLHMISYIHML
jgi:hypothetical protein